MKFSSKTRTETIDKLTSEPLDLLIIGGGITGAGLALQAGAKKMAAGLIEMGDFASGTSSRSTKLVHGGLRYLKQFEVELVSEIVKERQIISRNAPHIVRPEKMLLPVYEEECASFTAFSADIALDLYDRLAEVDKYWSYEVISKEEVLKEAPGMREKGLINGGLYLDYVNDDARLTIENIKKAHELGVSITNYVKAIDFIYNNNGQISGVLAEDRLSHETFEIQAEVVVNATGPWSDKVRNLQNVLEEERMFPTKGVHLVVDQEKLPLKRTVYTDTGLGDDRMIFIIPRGNKTYFGTTDTPYEGELSEPPITIEDVDYLLQAVNYRFPKAQLTLEDIETGWAGLRPLLLDEGATDPSKISRGHDVFVSEKGLVTIAGGKLTDYRLMAEDTFMTIADELKMKTGATYPEGNTETLPLAGGDLPEGMTMEDYIAATCEQGTASGLTEEQAKKFIQWYGTNAENVFALSDQIKDTELPLKLELTLLYALEYERILTPVDFFLRRTDILLFSTENFELWQEAVVHYMAEYLNWGEAEEEKQRKQLAEKTAQIQLRNLRKH